MPLIDLGRVLASQLIVWHHLTIYSPLQAQLDPLAPSLWSWLADPARMAVQIFLVMGGYLAAMQWLPHPDAGDRLPPTALPRALWQRYLRQEGTLKNKQEIVPNGVLHEIRRFHYDTAQANHAGALRALLSLVEVSQRLGHADVSITARVYAHYLPGQGHDTAERFAAMVSDGLAEAQSSPAPQALKVVD